MRVSEILVASLVAPLVAAHGGTPGAPKIFGLRHNAIADLKSRSIYGGHAHRAAQHAHGSLHARQGGADGRCGKDFGCATCDEGYCCSPGGWCGKGNDYCRAPDSLLDYGPGADANKVPSGGSTRNIARPKLGSISYGGDGIYACRNPGQIAITYDDGPYIYTSDLLDLFASYKFKATFFMTGINLSKGSIDDESTKWPALLRRMVSEGHQLASHTWSHQDLSAITQAQRYEQMVKLEMAMSNVIGKFPTYMRPPYSSCTAASGCEKDMEDLGYHVSYFDLDTDDYNNATPEKAQIPKDRVKAALDSKNSTTNDFLAIAHDIHDQTVHNLTSYMLDLMVKKGYKGVTMGECLGDPEENWYRSATGRVATTSVFTPPACASTISSSARSSASVSASPTSSSAIATPTAGSLDGSCGPTVGRTCLGFSGGECCSQYNYCGNTTGHCGVGCQSGFGKCDGSSSSGLASSSSVLASSQASSASLSNAPSSASNPSSTPGPSTKASSSSVAPSSAVTPPSTISSPARSSSAASSTIPSTTRSSTTPTQIPTPSPSPKDQISPNGTCGGSKGYTCAGSRFGDCCSTLGQCGSTLFSCSTWLGCNSKFGKCY